MPTLSTEDLNDFRGIIVGLLRRLTLLLFILSCALHDGTLLYLSVGTRAVIGQFCGLYSTVRPAQKAEKLGL